MGILPLFLLVAGLSVGQTPTASQATILDRLKLIHLSQPVGSLYFAPDGGVYQHKLAGMLSISLAALQGDITPMAGFGWVETTTRPEPIPPGVRILTAGITAVDALRAQQAADQAAQDAIDAAAAYDADVTATLMRANQLSLLDRIPAGTVIMVTTTCPSGFSEVAQANGRMPLGTLAANGNAGTTGGADNVTPVFTGTPLATHAHELPFQISSTTQIRQIAVAAFGTGSSRPATAQQTHTANTTNAAVALSQAVGAGTPAGTIAAIDNRSAFIRVVFCVRN